jgi:plastocyanin
MTSRVFAKPNPPLLAIALLAAVSLAGCGSSATKTGGESTARTAETKTAGSTGKTGTAAGGSSLKVTGTPKFASPSSSEPVKSGTVQIAYRNITINPDTLRVKTGTTIHWSNFDAVTHNVTSESGPQHFASGSLPAGKDFSVTLRKPGKIDYECTIHPATMNGSIEVVG